MKNKMIVSIFFMMMVFLIFLIQNIYAVAKIIPQDKPAADEMLVYVVRESNFNGSLVNIQVACNDRVMAILSSGSYCCFKVKSGQNIINIVESKLPISCYILKFSPGETVYLLFTYSSGVKQISTDLGEKQVSEYRKAPEKFGPNEGYDCLVMNPAFLNFYMMKKSEEEVKPDSENAVVTFIRQYFFAGNVRFGIWSEDEYLGTLISRTYFQIKVKPGKHFFIVKGRNASVVTAEVAAGKTYYIQLVCTQGLVVKLWPLNKRTVKDETLQEWMETLYRVSYNKDKVPNEVGILTDKAKLVIKDIIGKIQNSEIDTSDIEKTQLLVSDAR